MTIKIGQTAVITGTRMLKNKYSTRLNYATLEYFGRNLLKPRQVVGRISKYKIKRSRRTTVKKTKHIAAYKPQIIRPKTFAHLLDKPILRRSLLHRSHRARTAAEQFKSHSTSTRKKVKSHAVI